MAKFTDIAVKQIKPAAQRYEKADAGCPGLYLTVHPTGAKSWVVRFRSPIERDKNGQRAAKKLTLGPLALVTSKEAPQIGRPLSLSQARMLATVALEQVKHQKDPTHEQRAEKAKRKQPVRAETVDAAMLEFLAGYRGKKKQGLRDSTKLLTASYFGLRPDSDKPSLAECLRRNDLLLNNENVREWLAAGLTDGFKKPRKTAKRPEYYLKTRPADTSTSTSVT